MSPRTYLFVPSNRPERFAKASAAVPTPSSWIWRTWSPCLRRPRRARPSPSGRPAEEGRPGSHRRAHQRRPRSDVRRRSPPDARGEHHQVDAAQDRVSDAGPGRPRGGSQGSRARAHRERGRCRERCRCRRSRGNRATGLRHARLRAGPRPGYRRQLRRPRACAVGGFR